MISATIMARIEDLYAACLTTRLFSKRKDSAYDFFRVTDLSEADYSDVDGRLRNSGEYASCDKGRFSEGEGADDL